MRKSVYVRAYRSAGGAGRTDKYKQGLICARDTGRACEQFPKQSTTNKEATHCELIMIHVPRWVYMHLNKKFVFIKAYIHIPYISWYFLVLGG